VVAARELDRVTVRVAVDRYLDGVARAVAGHSLAATTAANYRRDLAEFVELAGPETVLDDITGAQLDDIVLAYGARPDGRFRGNREGATGAVPAPGAGKTRGAGATRRFQSSVSRFFERATRERWVEANPVLDAEVRVKRPRTSDPSRKAVPTPVAKALLDGTIATPPGAATKPGADRDLGPRDELIFRLLLETGIRVSELCGIDQADIEERIVGEVSGADDDYETQTWLRVLGKGSKERWVPLSPGTVAMVDAYVAGSRPTPQPRTVKDPETGERVVTVGVEDAERALLLTWRGLRIRPRDVQLMVKRSCDALPPRLRRRVTPHGLRHTAATVLVHHGVPVNVIKDLLGHASIATTDVYLDTVAEELVAAVNRHPLTSGR
jgi:site-specific recombinase XerD